MRIFYFIFIGIITFSACRKADVIEEKSFYHTYNSAASLAKQTHDGGCIALTNEFGSPVVYRISSNGNKIWRLDISSVYSTRPFLEITSLAPASDGSCLLGGNFFIDTSTYYRSVLFLALINAEGHIVSEKNIDTLLTAGTEYFQDIIPVIDNGWMALTMKNTTGTRSHLLSLNADLEINIDSLAPYSTYWKKIIQTSDGGYAMLGYDEYIQFDKNFILCKLDNDLNPSWIKRVGFLLADLVAGAVHDTISTVISDFTESANSEFLVCGHSNSESGSTGNNYDIFITKYNSDGDSMFTKFIHAPFNEYTKKIFVSSDNRIVITGTQSTAASEVVRYYGFNLNAESSLFKINSSSRCFAAVLNHDFSLEWMNNYGNQFGGDGLITIEGEDHSYLVCGNQISFGNKNALSLFALRVLNNGSLVQ